MLFGDCPGLFTLTKKVQTKSIPKHNQRIIADTLLCLLQDLHAYTYKNKQELKNSQISSFQLFVNLGLLYQQIKANLLKSNEFSTTLDQSIQCDLMESTESREFRHISEIRDSVEVLSDHDVKFKNKLLVPKSMTKHIADQPSKNSCFKGIRLSQIASKRLKQGLDCNCELRHCEFHQSEKKHSIENLYSKYEKKYQKKFYYQQSKKKQQQEVQRDKYDSKVKEYNMVGNTWKKVHRNPENSKEHHQNDGQTMIQTNTAKTQNENMIDLCSSDDELFKEIPAFICKAASRILMMGQ
eukprot:403344805